MPFVEQTLISVLGQTWPEIEYIVIDGASTDGTVDAIRRHESSIAKWISEPDAGIADAFNKGLVYVSGDYILFLNADDALAHQNVLAQMADALARENMPMIAYGDCDVLQRDSGRQLYRASVSFSRAGLLRGNMLPHPAMFARREYFDKYGNFDQSFNIAMDYEWLLRGALRETVVHLPMLVSRVRSGGLSTQSRQQAVAEIFAALKKNGRLSRLRKVMLHAYFSLRMVAARLKSTVVLNWQRMAGGER